MNQDILDRAWTILEEEYGAPTGGAFGRESFLAYAAEHDDWTEWLFMGRLGFGGKLWQEHYPKPRLYVNCAKEDETGILLDAINRTNGRLQALVDYGDK